MIKTTHKTDTFSRLKPSIRGALLIIGFILAICLRVLVGGTGLTQSASAGLIFGGCLLLLAATKLSRIIISRRVVTVGLLGGLALLAPLIIRQTITPEFHKPTGSFLTWGLIVSFVALAEEAFLRGTFFDALSEWRNETVALIVSAAGFAALHIPLYGWHIVPLDFFVGLLFGELRLAARSFVAPGIAHVLADLGSWWLR